MKTTKVIEIDVCDLCGTEQSDYDRFTCAGCLREWHRCCQNYFDVTVLHTKPTPASRSELSIGYPPRPTAHSQTGRREEFTFRGGFCEECAPRMEKILSVSGLSKTSERPENGGVVLDSTAPV